MLLRTESERLNSGLRVAPFALLDPHIKIIDHLGDALITVNNENPRIGRALLERLSPLLNDHVAPPRWSNPRREGEFTVPLASLVNPYEGFHVLRNRWWVCRDGEALGYCTRSFEDDHHRTAVWLLSPLCNHDRNVQSHVLKAMGDTAGLSTVFIPVAYWPDA